MNRTNRKKDNSEKDKSEKGNSGTEISEKRNTDLNREQS